MNGEGTGRVGEGIYSNFGASIWAIRVLFWATETSVMGHDLARQ